MWQRSFFLAHVKQSCFFQPVGKNGAIVFRSIYWHSRTMHTRQYGSGRIYPASPCSKLPSTQLLDKYSATTAVKEHGTYLGISSCVAMVSLLSILPLSPSHPPLTYIGTKSAVCSVKLSTPTRQSQQSPTSYTAVSRESEIWKFYR